MVTAQPTSRTNSLAPRVVKAFLTTPSTSARSCSAHTPTTSRRGTSTSGAARASRTRPARSMNRRESPPPSFPARSDVVDRPQALRDALRRIAKPNDKNADGVRRLPDIRPDVKRLDVCDGHVQRGGRKAAPTSPRRPRIGRRRVLLRAASTAVLCRPPQRAGGSTRA